MGTPDLTPYVDLTFFDKDPQDVFDAAILDLQAKLPGWVPREGNIEVLLLESFSLAVAEAIFAVNRLPGAVVMALLRLYGVDPDEGTLPTTTLTFMVGDTLGHEIPAGTGARLDLPGGLEPVVFTTDEAVVVPPGEATVTVAATGDRYTTEANGTAAGTALALIDAIAFVDTVELGSVVAGGVEPETDEEWVTRAVQRFGRLSETLVLPRHFETFALEDPAVTRAKALDNWDGSTGAPGDHPGHVSVAVYGDGGPVPAGTKTTLEASMEAQSLAMLDVHVVDPSVTAVPVTATIRTLPDSVSADVVTAVEAALGEYLDPSTWNWSATVRRNELIALISNVEGVDYVESLTAPAADLALVGPATLVDAGTLTITEAP
jgi:uncharacterized phage protein gp47/JayE